MTKRGREKPMRIRIESHSSDDLHTTPHSLNWEYLSDRLVVAINPFAQSLVFSFYGPSELPLTHWHVFREDEMFHSREAIVGCDQDARNNGQTIAHHSLTNRKWFV